MHGPSTISLQHFQGRKGTGMAYTISLLAPGIYDVLLNGVVIASLV
jgi:hypothetical protein